MCNEPIIHMENVSKYFFDVRALQNVNLRITPGQIVGILGANGGGKSTLLRHMIGLYLPNKGQCETLGCPTSELSPRELARIGYVHQEGELIDWMTVDQLIRYVASYYPTWNHELEKRFREEFRIPEGRRVIALSPGQRQRLSILLAVGFDPELLILDEPAAALDPIARQQFLDLLLQIIQDPKRTVLISSHILSDVEKVIDHVIMMDSGKILRDESFDDLREAYLRVKLTSFNGPLPEALPFEEICECRKEGREAVVTMKSMSRETLEERAAEINCGMEVLPLTLEDLYRLVIDTKSKGV